MAIVAAWPRGNGTFGTWAILAGAAALGLCFTASTLPAVNVLAVAIVLAAIAAANRGLTARAALVAALAATALGLVRFACDSIPTVWLAADAKGWLIGRLAGWMAGSRLEVGATYSGLDFLVLMTAVYAGWLICTAPPRRSRAIWAAVAILVGHLVYLMVLAHAEDLLAALPNTVLPPSNQRTPARPLDVEQWAANAGPLESSAAGSLDSRHDPGRDVPLCPLASGHRN